MDATPRSLLKVAGNLWSKYQGTSGQSIKELWYKVSRYFGYEYQGALGISIRELLLKAVFNKKMA